MRSFGKTARNQFQWGAWRAHWRGCAPGLHGHIRMRLPHVARAWHGIGSSLAWHSVTRHQQGWLQSAAALFVFIEGGRGYERRRSSQVDPTTTTWKRLAVQTGMAICIFGRALRTRTVENGPLPAPDLLRETSRPNQVAPGNSEVLETSHC